MDMRKRTAFRPVAGDHLEDRVVLNHGGFRNPSVIVAGLTPRVQGVGRHNPQPILALVNTAFDSFVRDYTQARAAYLSTLSSSSSSGTSGTTPKSAFTNYTQYRVELLANQVVSSVLQSAVGTAQKHGSGAVLPGLVARKLNGRETTPANGNPYRAGTLGSALISTIPDPQSSAAATSLSSLAQDQAIAAARVGVINGLNIMKNNSFGISSPHN
jgi:hypothetical protein